MQEHRIMIVGAQYAANPEYSYGSQETDASCAATIAMLKEINDKRPPVILVAEPSNIGNPHAVMARAMGRKIGYVSDDELPLVRPLLERSKRGMLAVEVDEVVIYSHGYLYAKLKYDGCTETQPPTGTDWSLWMDDLPLLPITEEILAEQEASFVLEEMLLPKLNEVDATELQTYLDIWMRGSRHDLSREARQLRSLFIERLEMSERADIRQMSTALKHQRTGMCSLKMKTERAKVWWPDLLASDNMVRLWKQWQEKFNGHLWLGLRSIDILLRQLPGEMYTEIGRLEILFTRLYYLRIPRKALHSILLLLLLRQLTCRELGIEMRSLKEAEYGTDDLVTEPMEMPTTIGRVVSFGQTQCAMGIERGTIQRLAQWLRDDYLQTHSKEIDALMQSTGNTPSTVIHGNPNITMQNSKFGSLYEITGNDAVNLGKNG